MVRSRALEQAIARLPESPDDESLVDGVLDRIGDEQVVLLGEASHGTHEFYRLRDRISRRLIAERGFHAIACEADWPDAYRVNRWVRGHSTESDARAALAGFQRFPLWMWRNQEVVELVDWLRGHNQARPEDDRAGFYGLDLYSMQRSMAEVLAYLGEQDPELAHEAHAAYDCLGDYADPQAYGYATAIAGRHGCQEEVLEVLLELQRRAADYLQRDGLVAADRQFAAERNAHLVRNAEAYYRRLYEGGVSTWNLRDQHMAECLADLVDHLTALHGEPGKVVVWAHNSHLGDARATDMGARGEWNIGHLARERWGQSVVNLGFTTAAGEVAAARDWGGEVERRRVREPLPASWERLFSDHAPERCLLDLRGDPELQELCDIRLLERAIGVIYRPETERQSHYFGSRLSRQFDLVIHLDRTAAVHPLDRSSAWRSQAPETYPSGL